MPPQITTSVQELLATIGRLTVENAALMSVIEQQEARIVALEVRVNGLAELDVLTGPELPSPVDPRDASRLENGAAPNA